MKDKVSALQRYTNLVGGKTMENWSGEWIDSVNPFTAQAWCQVPRNTESDAADAIEAAYGAFSSGPWSKTTPSERGVLLNKLADLIERDARKLAELEVRDNGKLFAEMFVQLSYIPKWFRYFGGLADKIEGGVLPIDKSEMVTFTRREPIGVVVAITPWNSPLMLLTWKLAPALAAGNTVVIKPSEYTSASTLEFVRLFEEAGFPPGVVNTVTGYGGEVGSALVKHPLVAKVAFTGGDATGAAVAAQAAAEIKHTTLELGGKSPNIVFADANLDNAVKGAISGIFAATGQTCIAGSRLLVQRTILDDFTSRVVEFAGRAKLGNPMDRETQVGPITTKPQMEKVLSYIDIARNEGAEVALGGRRAEGYGEGWFVEPTILTGVRNDMRIAQEEVFGPVLAIIPFEDEADAIRIANDSAYGLAAGVWTEDMRKAFRMTEALKAGTVWVNTYRTVSYMAPFGGMKRSGLGRESGIEAIAPYLQTKTCWFNLAEKTADPFVIG